MQKNIKTGKLSVWTDGIDTENLCFFGRKVGKTLNRLEKGEQLNIHRHVIQQ